MKKRIFSIFLTIAVIASLMPTNALAAAPIHVLALGDSITTGFGLANAEAEGFTALLGDPYTVTNKAVNGNTITGITAQLGNDDISAQEIAAADIITITAGGNDILALLYARIAECYNAENNTSMTAADVAATLKELHRSNLLQNYPLLSSAEHLLNRKNADYFVQSQEFIHTLTVYQQTLTQVTTALRKTNPDVRIIVATQYNPYAEFADHFLLHSFYAGMEEGISLLNTAIADGAAAGGYSIADVKTAFRNKHSSTNDLYHADPNMDHINLDFHPNANGHRVLAEVFRTAMENAISSDIPAVTLSPDTTCTREQAITSLWHAAGAPTPKSTETAFVDVPADSPCHDAVLWATENHITSGTSATTFSPDATCTREQIVIFLWRFSGIC